MKGDSPEGAASGAARYVGDYGPDTGRGGLAWKPLLVIGLLLLCFPLEGIAWMVAAVYLGAYVPLPRVLRD